MTANKRVQRTRHKVSGPLTRDVRRKEYYETFRSPHNCISIHHWL